MIWTNIKRILKLGFTNFRRGGLVSFASILTLTVTMFVIGALYLGTVFLNSSLEAVQSKVDISVSFKLDTEEEEIKSLQNDLSLLPEVDKVFYVSREQELSDFKERHKDNAVLIQSLEEVGNPFGARLNVQAVDPSQYDKIAKFIADKNDPSLGGKAIIDQISYKKDIVSKLVGVIETSQKIALVVSAVLAALSILVTFNTVSLAIYTSREEISVMRLVGAGNSYVKGPFLVEGVIAGVIGALLAMILLYPSAIWVKNITTGVYGGVDLVSFYASNFGTIFLLLVGSGIILGLIASAWAVRKYAKV